MTEQEQEEEQQQEQQEQGGNMAVTGDDRVAATSVALLAILDLGLKWKMSGLRTSGAEGEGDKTSFFEKLHNIQLLTTERVPTAMALIALSWAQARVQGRDLSIINKLAMIVSAISGFIFAGRAYDFNVNANGYNMKGRPGDGVLSPWGLYGTLGNYGSQLILAITLTLQL